MRILIVDDSPAIPVIVRRCVEQIGFPECICRLTLSALDALDVARTWEPDVILTDLHMPEMSGLELLQVIRREMLNIKLGVITADSNADLVGELMQAGAYFVLHKPFAPVDLVNNLKTLLTAGDTGMPVNDLIGSPAYEKVDSGLSQPLNIAAKPEGEPSRILLPECEILEKEIALRVRSTCTVVATVETPLDDSWFPGLMAVYQEKRKPDIRAICLLDTRAVLTLIYASGYRGKEGVGFNVMSPKHTSYVVSTCQDILSPIGKLMRDSESKSSLQINSCNLVPKLLPKLRLLLNDNRVTRVDYSLQGAVADAGRLMLLGF